MLENLLNSISDNPAYLAVAIVLITMITFSVIKKLFKIVTLGITLFILYCAYLLFTNQPLPNMDEIKTQLENSEEKIGDVIEDSVLDPLKEKTETIKNNLDFYFKNFKTLSNLKYNFFPQAESSFNIYELNFKNFDIFKIVVNNFSTLLIAFFPTVILLNPITIYFFTKLFIFTDSKKKFIHNFVKLN